jgi:hypothetical protein
LTNATEKADYVAATLQLSKTFDNGFYTMVAYTASKARDLDAAGGSQAISLWPATVQNDRNNPELSYAGFDQPNRLIGNLSYQKGGTTIGVFYEGGNAGRFSYTYSGNFGDASNRLLYVPRNASEINFESFSLGGNTITTQMQEQMLEAYIDQDEYLSSIRGQVAERNGGVAPWFHRFDVRILQDINFTDLDKNKLQLTFDFLNFGNLLNSNWGVPQVVNQSTLLNYRGQTNGVPTFRLNAISGTSTFPSETFRNTTNILGNTWRLQIGIKYIF